MSLYKDEQCIDLTNIIWAGEYHDKPDATTRSYSVTCGADDNSSELKWGMRGSGVQRRASDSQGEDVKLEARSTGKDHVGKRSDLATDAVDEELKARWGGNSRNDGSKRRQAGDESAEEKLEARWGRNVGGSGRRSVSADKGSEEMLETRGSKKTICGIANSIWSCDVA